MTKQTNEAVQTNDVVKAELSFNQVKLSDGRVIEFRRALGNDEMIVAANLGDTFMDGNAGNVIYAASMIAQTIQSIDGVKTQPLRDFATYRDFVGQFTRADWNKLRTFYYQLNGEQGNE